MSKHTPGPWVAVWCNEKCPFPCGPPIAIHRADKNWSHEGTICGMYAQGRKKETGGYDPVETEANAHLIAAAPDLFAKCKEVSERLEKLGMSDKMSPESKIACAIEFGYLIGTLKKVVQKAEGK